MKYDLRRPCPKCPFRMDVEGYLRPGRASGIVMSLLQGAEFACHETTVAQDVQDEEDDTLVETENSQHCAGALIMLEREGYASQMMRVAERLGVYDSAKLDLSAPVGRINDFVANHRDEGEPEYECCSVCDQDCEAPAGYMVDGVVVPSDEGGETFECECCGEPVCNSCSREVNGEAVCLSCVDDVYG